MIATNGSHTVSVLTLILYSVITCLCDVVHKTHKPVNVKSHNVAMNLVAAEGRAPDIW